MSTGEKAGGASKRGSHRLAQISQCERAWFLSWARQLQPKAMAPALTEGTAVHTALAYWWAARMPVAPAWSRERTMDEQLAKDTKGMPAASDLARRVLAAYDRHYAATEKWEPVAVEKEYFATVGALRRMMKPGCMSDPYDTEEVSARIDLVVRAGGKLWAVDHKTTKGYGATLPRWYADGEWAHSFQFLVQTLILRHAFGPDFGGVVVQRVKTSEPFDFDRNVVMLPPQILSDGPETILQQVKHEADLAGRIRAAISAGADPQTWLPTGNLWSCWSWGRSCSFRPICEAEPAQREQVVQLEYGKRE